MAQLLQKLEELSGVPGALYADIQKVVEFAGDISTMPKAERLLANLLESNPSCHHLYLLRARMTILNLKVSRTQNMKTLERRDAAFCSALKDVEKAFELRPTSEAASLALAIVRLHLNGISSLIMLDLNVTSRSQADKLNGSRSTRQHYATMITSAVANMDRLATQAESFLRQTVSNRRALLESMEVPIIFVLRRELNLSHDITLLPFQSDFAPLLELPSLLSSYVKVNVARLQGLAGAVLASRGMLDSLTKSERDLHAPFVPPMLDLLDPDKALNHTITKFLHAFDFYERLRGVGRVPEDLFGLPKNTTESHMLRRIGDGFVQYVNYDLRKLIPKPLVKGGGSTALSLTSSLILPPPASALERSKKEKEKEKDAEGAGGESGKRKSARETSPSPAESNGAAESSPLQALVVSEDGPLVREILSPDPVLDRLLDLDESAPFPLPNGPENGGAPALPDPTMQAFGAMRAAANAKPGAVWSWAAASPTSSGVAELDAILPPGTRPSAAELPSWLHRRLRLHAPTGAAAKSLDRQLSDLSARVLQHRDIWNLQSLQEREELLQVRLSELEDELVHVLGETLPRQQGEDADAYQGRLRGEARQIAAAFENGGQPGCTFTCRACGGGPANAFPSQEAFLHHLHVAHLRIPATILKSALQDCELHNNSNFILVLASCEAMRLQGKPFDHKLAQTGALNFWLETRKTFRCYRCNLEVVGNFYANKFGFNPELGHISSQHVLCCKCYYDSKAESERYPELQAKLEYLLSSWALQRIDDKQPWDAGRLIREAMGWPEPPVPAGASSAAAGAAGSNGASATGGVAEVDEDLSSSASSKRKSLGGGGKKKDWLAAEDELSGPSEDDSSGSEEEGESADSRPRRASTGGASVSVPAQITAEDRARMKEEEEGGEGDPPEVRQLKAASSSLCKAMRALVSSSMFSSRGHGSDAPAVKQGAIVEGLRGIVDSLEAFARLEAGLREGGQGTSADAIERILTEMRTLARHVRTCIRSQSEHSKELAALNLQLVEHYAFFAGLYTALGKGAGLEDSPDPSNVAKARAAVVRNLNTIQPAVLPRPEKGLQRLPQFLQEGSRTALSDYLGGSLSTPYLEIKAGEDGQSYVGPSSEWLASLGDGEAAWEGDAMLRWVLGGELMTIGDAAQIALIRELLAASGPDSSIASVASRLSTRMYDPLRRFSSIESAFDGATFPPEARSLCRQGSLQMGYPEPGIPDKEALSHYTRAIELLGGLDRIDRLPEASPQLQQALATLREERNVLAPLLEATPRLLRLLPAYHQLHCTTMTFLGLLHQAENKLDPIKARMDFNHRQNSRIIQSSLSAMSRQVESRVFGSRIQLNSPAFRGAELLDITRSTQETLKRQALEPYLEESLRTLDRVRKALEDAKNWGKQAADRLSQWIKQSIAEGCPTPDLPAEWEEEAAKILGHPSVLDARRALQVLSATMSVGSSYVVRLLSMLLVLSREGAGSEAAVAAYASLIHRRLQAKQAERSLAIAEALLGEANGEASAKGKKGKASKKGAKVSERHDLGLGVGVAAGQRKGASADAASKDLTAQMVLLGVSEDAEEAFDIDLLGSEAGDDDEGLMGASGAALVPLSGVHLPFRPEEDEDERGDAPALDEDGQLKPMPSDGREPCLFTSPLQERGLVIQHFQPTKAHPNDPGVIVISEDLMWLCPCGAINKGYGGSRRCGRCSLNLGPCRRHALSQAGCQDPECDYLHARFELFPLFSRETRRMLGQYGYAVLRSNVNQLLTLKELLRRKNGGGRAEGPLGRGGLGGLGRGPLPRPHAAHKVMPKSGPATSS